MPTQEDKIRLIHEFRTALLDRTFDELCRKSGSSIEQVSEQIVATAQIIQNALANSEEIHSPARGLFVLALQQVVDSFIAGLLTEEAFEWLAEEQRRMDQLSLKEIDFGRRQRTRSSLLKPALRMYELPTWTLNAAGSTPVM